MISNLVNHLLQEFKDQDLFYSFGAEFKQSMKMECIDPRHQSCFCVVSVVEAQGARLRLHFDGWSENYDFWINADSSFLYPRGWCEKNGQKLCPPRRELAFVDLLLEVTLHATIFI